MKHCDPESVPAGIALTAFGLAVIAHDGLLALVAFAATAGGLVVIASQLL